jgi:hypothetical protein
MHLDLAQRGTSPTRGWPVDVPSVDGRMLAVGSELAVGDIVVCAKSQLPQCNTGNA